MKILINTRFLLKDKLEGIGWFSFEVARRLAQWHPEIEFVYAFDRAFDESFITSDNIKPVVLFPPARHPFLFYAFFEWAMPSLIKKEKPDLFFSPDGFLSLSSNVPTVLTIHDLAYLHFPKQKSWIQEKYYAHYVPKFAHHASRITTVSTYTKNDIIDKFGIEDKKIDVTYNGYNLSYAPISEAEKQKVKNTFSQGEDYFLYVGSIHPRKNIPNILRAFEQFKSKENSKIKLVLVGRMAWQTSEVGAVYDKMKYKNDVIFLGYQSIENLHKIVAAAFANVYVSFFEGFGIPILESLKSGVPVIASNTSSMPEVLGNAGLLVEPSNVEHIAQAMQAFYKDEKLRLDCAEKGLLQSEKFSWDYTAQKVWKSIETVLTKS